MILIVGDNHQPMASINNMLSSHNFNFENTLWHDFKKKIFENDYLLLIFDLPTSKFSEEELLNNLSRYGKKSIPVFFLVDNEHLVQSKTVEPVYREYIDYQFHPEALLHKIQLSIKFYKLKRELASTKKALLDEIEKGRLSEEKKENFINIISHEIKIPLTSIKAYNQLAQSAIADTDYRNLNDFLKKSENQITKLNRLVANLFLYSRINHAKLEYQYEDFDIEDYIKASIDIVQHSFPGREIIYKGNTMGSIFGDRVRLEQVLLNLLSNALKYSSPECGVEVHVAQENNKIKIEVKDKGIGISKANQKMVFQKFYRAANKHVHAPGLGLGLFISAEIIQHHHGEIGFTSVEGEGSNFYFMLPFKQI